VAGEIRFNVFGRVIAVAATASGWAPFHVGDGKRRPASFVIPDFVTEEELGQYLYDLFHESATPANGDVVRVG
jgi:hypothetical protein